MANRKAPKLMLLHTQLQQLWLAALDYDGLEPEAKFVVFSDDNPHMVEYNRIIPKFLRLKKAHEARAARRDAIESLGMKEVRGALGGRYIE